MNCDTTLREPVMLLQLTNAEPVQLPRRVVLKGGAVWSIDAGAGRAVVCVSGALWLTQEGDVRDIVLGPGESFVIDTDGRVVVSGLGDAVAAVV